MVHISYGATKTIGPTQFAILVPRVYARIAPERTLKSRVYCEKGKLKICVKSSFVTSECGKI